MLSTTVCWLILALSHAFRSRSFGYRRLLFVGEVVAAMVSGAVANRRALGATGRIATQFIAASKRGRWIMRSCAPLGLR